MAQPDESEVRGALAALNLVISLGELCAYPVTIDGVRVTVLGRIKPKSNGLFDSTPIMVIVNDELATKMDLTEARS